LSVALGLWIPENFKRRAIFSQERIHGEEVTIMNKKRKIVKYFMRSYLENPTQKQGWKSDSSGRASYYL
jgi:hypothetical protein